LHHRSLLRLALNWIILNQGGKFNLIDDDKYRGWQQLSAFDQCTPVSGIASVQRLCSKDEESLKDAVALGPAVTVIDAGLLVDRGESRDCGYGSDGETDFWIARNSWGVA
jgi:hypothetical protein